MTSDGGVVLLHEVERRTGLLAKFAACFTDYRRPDLISHSVEELVRQRVFAMCCGYEDLNDHATLRTSNIDGSAGVLDEVERIVAKLRSAWQDR